MSYVDTLFVLKEKLFGRPTGIRLESTHWADDKGNEGRIFHTWRSALIYAEHCIKTFIKKRRLSRFHVYIPVLWTPQGIPVLASPYLFAIGFASQISATQGADNTLELNSVVVAAGSTLIVGVMTNGSNTNTPITGGTFNTTENLSKLKTDFNSTGTLVTADLWQLAAPSATTAQVQMTSSHNPENMYGTAIVYSGAKTSGVATNVNSAKAQSNSPAVTISSTIADSWTVGCTISDNVTATSSTGWTVRTTGGIPPTGDSNGVTGGGNFTMNGTIASGTNNWVFVGAELLNTAASTGRFRSLLGVGL